jgi:NAD(P)H dehydrogenase (quinone)
VTLPRQRIAIIGGGPGGYEVALVAAQLQRLTAEQLTTTFAVYPSLSGSITEAARKLMEFTPDSP